jgi:uroporphyrinogen III methyltransferase/synthase
VRIAAIGTGTADQLARHRLRADLVPDQFDAGSLAEDLIGRAERRRFLLARSTGRPSLLADALDQPGVRADQVIVHGNVNVKDADPQVAAALSAGEIDWVTVASSSTARSLSGLYGDALPHARLASIGPLTSATLRSMGLVPAVEASPHSVAGLVDAIQRVHQGGA